MHLLVKFNSMPGRLEGMDGALSAKLFKGYVWDTVNCILSCLIPVGLNSCSCFERLHSQDQNYWCCVQCFQQRAGADQDPGEELHRAHRQHPIPAVVRGPLCPAPRTQEGCQAGTPGVVFLAPWQSRVCPAKGSYLSWTDSACQNRVGYSAVLALLIPVVFP